MVTNPMQRKARNSFLLGMTVTLLIAACIIGVLIMQINKMKKEMESVVTKEVAVLTQEVKSGQIMTEDMFVTKEVDVTIVPANAPEAYSNLAAYFLKDLDGNNIQTLYIPGKVSVPNLPIVYAGGSGLRSDASQEDKNNKGNKAIQLYIDGQDSIQEIYTDKDTGKTFMMVKGQVQEVQSTNILTDEDGDYIILEGENIQRDDHVAVFTNGVTGEFYKYKVVKNAEGKQIREKVFFETTQNSIVAKVNMLPNTVMTLQYMNYADEQITDDVRKTEVNTVLLPANIEDGEHIDIRLRLPTGEDYIVIAKKQIELLPLADTYSENTMYLQLDEIEIETLSNAIVEAAMIEGAYLYANKYVEAGMQDQAKTTYYPSYAVIEAMSQNENLTNEAKTTIINRYNAYSAKVRARVEGNITEDAFDNAYEGIEEEVASKQEQRKQYLDSLAY